MECPECERDLRDGSTKCPCGWKQQQDEKPITVKCCRCKHVVTSSGWCDNCDIWPINMTPIRYCERGHRVKPDGWCFGCTEYVRTELFPDHGEWRDTGIVPNRLGKEAVVKLVADVAAKLSGPGWPEKQVPLRIDYIPRSWKRRELRKVGETPLGFAVVLPEGNRSEEEVPF